MTSIKHDGTFDIATGKSRRETHWHNTEIRWSDFLKKISKTHYTAEKYSEYMAAKKTRQDEIKDIGGFVGGYVNNGRRKAENILHRQLITLDIDFSKDNIWEDCILLYNNAIALYSTHKHKSENPRLRLLIPLDRPVSGDEYVAISRRIAGSLGIDNFDDTTFQPERLMYWPSTAKDGEYVFEYQDGLWMSANEILDSYKNWQDASEWPVSDRAGKIIRREIKKQGDPLEKPGIIGVFCRTYNIHEAIEVFLSDVYIECDVENRYTYKEGSTAAGLVIYDDKYSFSHHGTDPTSLKLCNAFDLVRLHLFGLKDEDSKEGTPVNKLPSYTAMQSLASADKNVRKQIGIERLQGAKEEFAELYEEEVDTTWLEKMGIDTKGNYHSTIANIKLILDNDPAVKDSFAKNNFEKREISKRDLPWRKINSVTCYLSDVDDAGLRDYLEATYGITGVQKIKDGLDLTVEKNSFHPVKEYLKAVVWDGESRIDTILVDYLGAEDTPYVRAVTRKTLVAAVARIFQPGIKFDYVLVIVGKQGIGKSTLLKKLGKNWYSDSFGTVQGKEAYEQIQGVWLIEMGELAGLKKAEMETIKHFISKQEDRYRVAYGRRIENFPRQCVFFGTTNDKEFLRDPTGNRRFWPVDAGEIEPAKNVFDDLNDYEIDQIWAEAVELYNKKESRYLDKDLEAQAYQTQLEHSETDERIGLIQEYLAILLPEKWNEMDAYSRRSFIQGDALSEKGVTKRERICVAEIWCEFFGKPYTEMTKYNTKEIHNIMKNMKDWTLSKFPVRLSIYGNQRVYRRL
jgi:Predicted P-loop ATPase and inactivated derivatives